MQEALEKWDCRLVEKVLPEVYGYVLMINERFIGEMYKAGKDRELIQKLAPVSGGMVNMANMAVYMSSYTNGVAEIHTEILKTDTLKDWYNAAQVARSLQRGTFGTYHIAARGRRLDKGSRPSGGAEKICRR